MPGKKKAPNSPNSYQDYQSATALRSIGQSAHRIVDATINAIIGRTDGKRLQVDFGKDETALVYLWQVVERIRW
jgi:hypothetical protein